MTKKKSIRNPVRKKRTLAPIDFGPQRNRKHTRAYFMVSTSYGRHKDTIIISEDISMGGVFLETPDPLPKGTKVKMRFPLRSSYRPIHIEGKVMWNRTTASKDKLGSKTPGMGIVFEKIKKKDESVLKEFIGGLDTYGWYLGS